jgi:transposase
MLLARDQALVQAPVPAHVIDKRMPTAGLLAQVLIAKYLDHLPLYRQGRIFERPGFGIPRSMLAQWVGPCGVVKNEGYVIFACWSITKLSESIG